MHKIFRSRVAAVAVGSTLVVGLSAGTAVGHGLIGSDDIRRGAVEKQHISQGSVGGYELRHGSLGSPQLRDGAVRHGDLSDFVVDQINDRSEIQGLRAGVNGLEGRVTSLEGEGGGISEFESDGPYPGGGNPTLQSRGEEEGQEGAQSEALWVNDNTLQRSWVMCAPGKVALGGGFTLAADASLQDKLATQVVTSQPVQVVDGSPDAYHPIEDDAAGSFVPNGWLVEGVYTGDKAAPDGVIVRPHVICAEVEDAELYEPEDEEVDDTAGQ